MIPLPTKLILALTSFIVLMVGIIVFGQHRFTQGETAATERATAAIAMLKVEAAKVLATETERVHRAEQALNDFKNAQELQDAEHLKTIAYLSDRLRRLAGASGRLRDPHSAGCGGGGSTPAGDAPSASSAGPADDAEAGGLLSEPLSRLLLRITGEADTINAAYASCRATLMEP